jgi:simple sugar transport system permease protein
VKLPSALRRALRRLVGSSRVETVLISVSALVFSVGVSVIVLLFSGIIADCAEPWTTVAGTSLCYDPVLTLEMLFVEPLTDANNLAVTLRETTLLIFAGLAVVISFRAGLFNIGVQGQMIAGSIAATVALIAVAPIVADVPAKALLLIPFGFLVGALFGGLWGLLPGLLKAYGEVNEVISTIMLNFVAANFAFVLVQLYAQDPESNITQTEPLPTGSTLEPVALALRSNFSEFALAIALLFAVGVFLLFRYTRTGYAFRLSGLQPEAAEYSGVNSKATIMSSLALSGAISGIGGAVWAMMIYGGWAPGMPGYGFDGLAVSILAGNSAVGVIPAAALFGILTSGANLIDFGTSVPNQLVGILRGLIILAVAMPGFFRILGRQVITLEPAPEEATDE